MNFAPYGSLSSDIAESLQNKKERMRHDGFLPNGASDFAQKKVHRFSAMHFYFFGGKLLLSLFDRNGDGDGSADVENCEVERHTEEKRELKRN